MTTRETLVLRDDVLILPVSDLEPEVRVQFECEEDDFAVSRPMTRTPSSVVDARCAGLLELFRKERTIVEAVLLFSHQRGEDPEQVLETAHPVLLKFLGNRFLVAAEDARPEVRPDLEAGARIGDGLRVERVLQVLEDTEIVLVSREPEGRMILKIERPADYSVSALFDREAVILRHLDGRSAPRLIDQGQLDGRRFLLLERIAGLPPDTVAAQLRSDPDPGARERLLVLCRRLAEAYAGVHALGVLHVDVHPRNVLVGRNLDVKLIDFGWSRMLARGPLSAPRGGIPFYYEPEYAEAHLKRTAAPEPSEAGEQFAVAALIYNLATGLHYVDFSLERDRMLQQIASSPALPFDARGVAPWPDLERVLLRALSKSPSERYASMEAFATALESVMVPAGRGPVRSRTSALDEIEQRVLSRAARGGEWMESGLDEGPTSSANYGAAGIAYALYRISSVREDPLLLSLADTWACRASSEIRSDRAFRDEEFDIGPDTVGESSILHSETGVWLVQTFLARAMGDAQSEAEGLERFLVASEAPAKGLDLTLGRSSTLLGCVLLADLLTGRNHPMHRVVTDLGDTTLDAVWSELAREPAIRESSIQNLGIAHGWAGFLYATLLWCRMTSTKPSGEVLRRLAELAALAEPTGRGVRWPWMLTASPSEATYMPGWCNGTAGYVFLWTLAHEVLGDAEYLALAEDAGWEAYDSPERHPSLCCGLAGRSYALLSLFRHTEDEEWLRRARTLGETAATEHSQLTEAVHSLYKGETGLAALSADLDRPSEAAFPLFEVEGWAS